MKLIGLTGPAGSGKDTIADRLCEHHGFVRYALASPIKLMLEAIGVGPECWENRNMKEAPHPLYGISPRRMAQTLGTEWGRQLVCDDIWLRCAARFVDDLRSHGFGAPPGIVITDVRFQNEAAFVAERGGWLWHVQRLECPLVEAHSSEAGVPFLEGDARVYNFGTIAQLHRYVDGLMEGA